MGGLNYSDNVALVPSDQKESGTWFDLVFLPGYRFDLGSSQLDLSGIFLWEKYTKKDQAPEEIQLNQVTLGYLNPGMLGKWKLEGGYRTFGTENDGLVAKSQEGNELFFGGNGPLDLGVPLIVTAKFTQRVLTNGGTEGYDPDGNLYQVSARWTLKGNGLSQNVSGGFDLMDAKGQYKDNQALRLGYGLDLPLSQTMGLKTAYDLKKTDYSKADPAYGVAESDLRHRVSAEGTYRFGGIEGLAALGEVAYETRSSNLDARTYTASLFKISALYSF
ncbi:MAG: hypothetical protein RRB13_12035 [bacterium]|nr:hypothetical protein [bacterium]